VASITSNKVRALLLTGGIDLDTNTLKVMLVGTGYTPDKDHNFADSITGGSTKELSGTGYTGGFGGGGRKTLASVAVTQDDATDKAYLDAADVTWTAIDAGTVAYAVVIREVTADSDSPIIVVVDIAPDVVTNGGDYTIQWAADGILNLT